MWRDLGGVWESITSINVDRSWVWFREEVMKNYLLQKISRKYMLVPTPSKSIGHYVKKVILWGVPMGLLILGSSMGGTN